MAQLSDLGQIAVNAKTGQQIVCECNGTTSAFNAYVIDLNYGMKYGGGKPFAIDVANWEKGWPKEEESTENPFYFQCKGGSGVLKLECYDTETKQTCESWCSLQYSTNNGKTWKVFDDSKWISFGGPEYDGKILIRADPDNPNVSGFCELDEDGEPIKCHTIWIDGDSEIEAHGNIQYLLTYDGSRTDVPPYAYHNLFGRNGTWYNTTNGMTTAPELCATTLAQGCYSDMFFRCIYLKTPPKLPATALKEECYSGMFSYCSSLQYAPCLPASQLCDWCYSYMFGRCTSLSSTPELSSLNLAYGCYDSMFERCINISSTPDLPATELKEYCYSNMFSGCSSLALVKSLPASVMADYCYSGMFEYCNSLTGLSSVPFLPITKTAVECCKCMFMSEYGEEHNLSAVMEDVLSTELSNEMIIGNKILEIPEGTQEANDWNDHMFWFDYVYEGERNTYYSPVVGYKYYIYNPK